MPRTLRATRRSSKVRRCYFSSACGSGPKFAGLVTVIQGVRFEKAALLIWLPLVTLLGAYTSGVHGLALPRPREDEVARASWERLLGERGGAAHVLYASCKCSQRITDTLSIRGELQGVREVVLVVGSLGERESVLRLAGFEVVHADRRTLHDQYGIEAAPLLAILGQRGRVLYSGGYRLGEGAAIEDSKIIADVLRGRRARSRPLLGCAVSDWLQRAVDPLGLKN